MIAYMIRLVLFFNDTAATEIYTLSLHDALPIWLASQSAARGRAALARAGKGGPGAGRSEEHTSELQSRGPNSYAVLCLKKKNSKITGARHVKVQPDAPPRLLTPPR